ncbi:MAG: hypothetical protein E6K98_02730 [Thaumarchaeota archaeon]|nr:MAG: hypothetical protein E6K98_02730 [Nitrososphaerota archaeon]
MEQQPILSFTAVALLVIGLVGNGFEMRKIRLSTTRDEELASKNVFVNKRNIKWYILIGIAIVLWAINGAYTRSI